jgi:hypothetical protein
MIEPTFTVSAQQAGDRSRVQLVNFPLTFDKRMFQSVVERRGENAATH